MKNITEAKAILRKLEKESSDLRDKIRNTISEFEELQDRIVSANEELGCAIRSLDSAADSISELV